jgi:hypothetical protein
VTTLIKLLLAAAIINAAARYGLSAWTQYEFRDAVQQILLFGAEASTDELKNEIMMQAERQGVPLEREALDVEQRDSVVTARAGYLDEIELFPRYVYPKTWEFSLEVRHVDMRAMTGRAPRSRPR